MVAMEQLIDDKIGSYSQNSIVGPMIEELKDKYRAAIIDKAAEARLKGDTSDGE